MDAIILNMFEVNYSQLILHEILEKLVTYIDRVWLKTPNKNIKVNKLIL